MPVFSLDKFPHVCRLCMKAYAKKKLTSLDEYEPIVDGTIGDFLAAITFVIAEDKAHLFPQVVCIQCLEMLKFFAKYRNKIMTIHLFMNSLIELKRSNSVPVVDLFENKKGLLNALFKDLDLCSKTDVTAQDLIDEFPTYMFATMSENKTTKLIPKMERIELDELDIKPGSPLIANNPEEQISQSTSATDKVVVKKPRRSKPVFNVRSLYEDTDDEQKEESENDDPSADTRKYGGRKMDHPMQCPKCKFSTYYFRNFQTHKLVHLKRERRKYHCKEPECTEVFNELKQLQSHVHVVHKTYTCETCGLRCSTQHALNVHKERHDAEFNYNCPYCQKRNNTKGDLRTHIRLCHIAEKNYACETCGLSFKRKDIRDNHQRTHADVFEFPCNLCEKKFKNPCALRKHRTGVHDRLKKICEYCNSAYDTRFKLMDHIEYAHGIQRRFLCDICVQSFESQEMLDLHKTRHESPKDFECGVCLELFSSTEQMADHLCITYRDDYICCDRDFRYHYQYNKHMFTKHGIKTNVRVKPIPGQLLGFIRAKRKRIECCPKCESVFPSRTQKKQHMLICVGPPDSAPPESIIEDVEIK